MNKVDSRPRSVLRIRRIFERDPARAAAVLARLLVAQPCELASEPGDDSRIDSSLGVAIPRFSSLDQIKENSSTASLSEALGHQPATQGAAPPFGGATEGEEHNEVVW